MARTADAAQHCFRRQTLPAGFLEIAPTQILSHLAQHITMRVQPVRYRLQFAADLVFGEQIKYTCLDGAFLAHCRLRRLRVCL